MTPHAAELIDLAQPDTPSPIDTLRHRVVRVRITVSAPPLPLIEAPDDPDTAALVEHLRTITTAQRAARLLLHAMSAPAPDGSRLLPVVYFADFLTGFSEQAKLMREGVAALKATGSAEAERMAGRVHMTQTFESYPDGKFPAIEAVNPAIAARLEEAARQDAQATIKDAHTALLSRLGTPLAHLIERMDIYNKRAPTASPRTGAFRDTVVTNIRDIFERMDGLTFADDAAIAHVRSRIIGIARTDPAVLRTSEPMRKAVRARAAEVLETLAEWGITENEGDEA